MEGRNLDGDENVVNKDAAVGKKVVKHVRLRVYHWGLHLPRGGTP